MWGKETKQKRKLENKSDSDTKSFVLFLEAKICSHFYSWECNNCCKHIFMKKPFGQLCQCLKTVCHTQHIMPTKGSILNIPRLFSLVNKYQHFHHHLCEVNLHQTNECAPTEFSLQDGLSRSVFLPSCKIYRQLNADNISCLLIETHSRPDARDNNK